jgi:hypothetical protein
MFELKAWPLFLLSKEYENFHYNYGMCDKQKESRKSNKSNAEVGICLYMYAYANIYMSLYVDLHLLIISVCMHINVYLCVYIHAYIYITFRFIHIYVRTPKYIHVYLYTGK